MYTVRSCMGRRKALFLFTTTISRRVTLPLFVECLGDIDHRGSSKALIMKAERIETSYTIWVTCLWYVSHMPGVGVASRDHIPTLLDR